MPENEVRFKFHKEYSPYSECDIKKFRKIVKNLSKLEQYEQRSPEWFAQRKGKITASSWGEALNMGHYGSPKECARKKVFPKPFYGGKACDWGKKYEMIAQKIYERRNKVKIIEFGLIPNSKYDFIGASPDGITRDGIMLEIKCPYSRVIDGIPPEQYWAQMQGQLECCDLEACDFLEITLAEYDDENKYFADLKKLEKSGIDLNTNEIGCVAVLLDKRKREEVYEYPDKFFMNKKQIKEWHDKLMAGEKDGNYKFMDFDYFRVDVISCIRVYRDREWLAEAIPKLKKFWQKVKKCMKIDDLEKKTKKFEKYFGTTRSRNKNGLNLMGINGKVKQKYLSYDDIFGMEEACEFSVNTFSDIKLLTDGDIESNLIKDKDGNVDFAKSLGNIQNIYSVNIKEDSQYTSNLKKKRKSNKKNNKNKKTNKTNNKSDGFIPLSEFGIVL